MYNNIKQIWRDTILSTKVIDVLEHSIFNSSSKILKSLYPTPEECTKRIIDIFNKISNNEFYKKCINEGVELPVNSKGVNTGIDNREKGNSLSTSPFSPSN